MSLPTEDGVNDVQSGLCCYVVPLLSPVVVPCCSSFERNVFWSLQPPSHRCHYLDFLHNCIQYAGYFQLFVIYFQIF